MIRTALRAQIEILRTSIEALAADVAHMLDKDLGLILPKLKDKVVRNYVFHFRKGGWARVKDKAIAAIRPARNVLPGYEASFTLHRVLEEDG